MSSDTVAGLEPRWRATRRARMVAAARDVFRTHSPETASIDDIVRAAGIGRATLYRYFDTKEALVRACLDDVLSRLNDRLEAAEAGPGAPPARLRRIIGAMVETFSADLMPLRLITRRESELREEWRLTVHDARQRLVTVLGEHFRRGMSAGRYRELDGDLIAHLVMGMIRSGVTHVDGMRPEALADAIHDFVIRATAVPDHDAPHPSSAANGRERSDHVRSGGPDVDR